MPMARMLAYAGIACMCRQTLQVEAPLVLEERQNEQNLDRIVSRSDLGVSTGVFLAFSRGILLSYKAV